MRVKVKMNIKLDRPSTGSALETGIAFQADPEENREDHISAAERMIGETFPGWRISAMQFV